MALSTNEITVRDERDGDAHEIEVVTQEAFREVIYSSHTEHHIINHLRESENLTVSLVAEDPEQNAVVGHVAVSPVQINDGIGAGTWYGLGPVAVKPGYQKRGIGSRLVEQVLQRLRDLGASGCVVLGNPNFYQRFGFRREPSLGLAGAPAAYFQAVVFDGVVPKGMVTYHESFNT
eukprot:gb/GECG01000358.1/.p1 GENE.gb/GECG01000358.1/~~gb/GECG01000358.1/.p1  ORF type:complete len:176 (+),score=14.24 gb/GECG01000358.1/:1-528(+)